MKLKGDWIMNEITERNIALCVVLSLITCGIYSLY